MAEHQVLGPKRHPFTGLAPVPTVAARLALSQSASTRNKAVEQTGDVMPGIYLPDGVTGAFRFMPLIDEADMPADGQFLKRVGNKIVGAAGGGGTGLLWSSFQTANFNAVAGTIWIYSGNANLTATLPASPSNNDRVGFFNFGSGNFALLIDGNGAAIYEAATFSLRSTSVGVPPLRIFRYSSDFNRWFLEHGLDGPEINKLLWKYNGIEVGHTLTSATNADVLPGGDQAAFARAWLVSLGTGLSDGALVTGFDSIVPSTLPDFCPLKVLQNNGNKNLYFSIGPPVSTAGNRINTWMRGFSNPAPLCMAPGDSAFMIYEFGASPGWRLVGLIPGAHWTDTIFTGAGPHAVRPWATNRYDNSAAAATVLHIPDLVDDNTEIAIKESAQSANAVTVTTPTGTLLIERPSDGALVTSLSLAAAGSYVVWKMDDSVPAWRLINKVFV